MPSDFWTERAKFEKTGNFITRDWTQKTIIIDLVNAMGEKYHFEVEPEADAGAVPTRPANGDTVLCGNGILLFPRYSTPPLR